MNSKTNSLGKEGLASSKAESKKQSPWGYEITRLFSVVEDKEKRHKRFASIPNVERAVLGAISKVRFPSP